MIRENKFKKIYEKVIAECNIYNVITEYVNDSSTTPINKNLFNYICSQVRKPTSYIKISFDKILSFIQKDTYNHINKLIEILQNNSNNFLYIFSISVSDEKDLNSFYKFLINKISNEEYNYIKSQYNFNNITSTGLTLAKRKDNLPFYIIINRYENLTWKDTLEHELTHFIQKLIGNQISLPKVKGIQTSEIDHILNDIFSYIDAFHFSNDKEKYSLFYSLKYMLNSKELHQSIKNCLNFLQRTYENHNKHITRQLEHSIDKNSILNYRLNWLNEFTNYLTSDKFKKLFKNKIENNTLTLHERKELFYKMSYSALLLVEDMKIKSINHFKTFKFRDN